MRFERYQGDPGSIPGSGRSAGEGIGYLLQYTWASLVAQLVKNLQCKRPQFNSWIRKLPWRRDRLSTSVFLGFPCGSAGKESAYNAGDLGSILGLGRSPGEWIGYPLQYSGLENSMHLVHWAAKSRTRLRNFKCKNRRSSSSSHHPSVLQFSTLATYYNFL